MDDDPCDFALGRHGMKPPMMLPPECLDYHPYGLSQVDAGWQKITKEDEAALNADLDKTDAELDKEF